MPNMIKPLHCPECNNVVARPGFGYALPKCFNASGHESGASLVFELPEVGEDDPYRITVSPWLEAAMGNREKAVCRAPDVQVTQCLPECWEEEENRLPSHQQHVYSLSMGARFMIDNKQRKIVG